MLLLLFSMCEVAVAGDARTDRAPYDMNHCLNEGIALAPRAAADARIKNARQSCAGSMQTGSMVLQQLFSGVGNQIYIAPTCSRTLHRPKIIPVTLFSPPLHRHPSKPYCTRVFLLIAIFI
jgi:hypothetical protein